MRIFVFLLLSALVLSCNNAGNHSHFHNSSEDEIEPLAYTLYSEKLELFVEFRPLIVGATSKFAAHFTVLGDRFTALSEGEVSVSLLLNGNAIKQTANKPASPGIFRLALTPTFPGKGKLIFDLTAKTFTDRIVIEEITVYPDKKTAMENPQTKTAKGESVTYLKEQAWKTEFANVPIKKQPFREVIKTTGQIIAAQGDEILIAANSGGIILFESNQIVMGAAVGIGEQLFTISSENLTEGNNEIRFKESKAGYEKAKADFERGKELAKDNIISQKDFQQLQLYYENAQIVYNALAKNRSDGGKKILSPAKGFIKNIFVAEGQFIKEGEPIAIISRNRRLQLKAEMPQHYFSKLASISAATFKTTYDNKVYTTEELNGKILSYGRSVQDNTPFIPLIIEIDNMGDIIPGSFVEIFLKTGAVKDALIIPISSLLEEQGIFYVYVQTAGESFQKREVKSGATDGINVQLLSGVNENERVVTRGAYQIKMATMSGTLPVHGHEH